MKIALAFILCLAGASSAFALNCASGEYRMLCRGKMGVEFYGNIGGVDRSFLWIKPGTHMPTGAGQRGENLIAGTCAFVDRPVRINEPNRLRFFVTTHAAYTNVGLITQCLGDRDCALETCVQSGTSDVGPIFFANPDAIQLNYPAFIR